MIEADLYSRLLARGEAGGRIYGVVPGLVTNIADPEGLGRVKVEFPWMGDQAESTWARIAAPMAGNGRGAMLLPEVDDEVLVAFEHGLPDRPYVVGCLWNGKDAPPVTAVEGGKVKLRAIKTRAGHTVEFQEDQGGKQGHIRIATAGGHSLLLSDDDGKLELKSGRHAITMDDQGQKLSIAAQGSLEICCGDCTLSFSQSGLELKQGGSALTFGPAGGKLEALPELTVKGGLLKLNPPG